MNLSAGGAKSFGKQVYREIQDENVTFMAAGIAYQAFVSLIPLLVLLFFLLTIVGDQTLANRVVDLTRSFLPQSAQRLLKQSIAGSAASTGASIIGLVTVVWGAFKIFKGLDTAFSEIFDTTSKNSFVDKLKDGAVVFTALGGALLAAAVATAAFGALNVPFVGLLNPLLLVVGISIAFFPMYYVFPDMDLSPTDVLPGVVVGAVGWAALQSLFQVYIAFAGKGGASAIGAVLLLLTWLYFSGLILLLGAVVNAVHLGRAGDTGGPNKRDRSDADAKANAPARANGAAGAGGAGQPREADPVAIREERERLHRERDRLRQERRELRAERRKSRSESESESRAGSEDTTGDEDAAELRREKRALARRVRWCEKPVWERALLRALGRDAPDDPR